jgi:hypothetical protein
MDIFEWIDQELRPEACSSAEFIYDDMESQSGRCLPIINARVLHTTYPSGKTLLSWMKAIGFQ